MSRTPVLALLLAATVSMALCGCHRDYRRFGPPPPSYACDGYGCDGYDAYGGFSECVDDGQYYDSHRGPRRWRRDGRSGLLGRRSDRRGRYPDSINGLPVVAAYLLPMEMMNGCGCGCDSGGWVTDGCCCDSCYSCGDCPPCNQCPCDHVPGYGPCGPNGCAWDAGVGPHHVDYPPEAFPSEAYPHPGAGDGGPINPVPVPPVQEGPWNPPIQQIPRTNPEPEASRPAGTTTWIPAGLQ